MPLPPHLSNDNDNGNDGDSKPVAPPTPRRGGGGTLTNAGARSELDELARLAAVRRYDILDTPPDGAFDRITALAARYFEVPIALVSIVDSDRVWFKSTYGLEVDEVGDDPGLCASVVMQDEPWIVENAPNDPRTLAHPLVAEGFGLEFYAAVPLKTHDGFNLGTFCLLDYRPRALTAEETQMLIDMAGIVMDELELRLASREAMTKTSIEALLTALDAHDGYSGSHSREVVSLALRVARELGLSEPELHDIESVALLHDIGKIGISHHILRKPGPLSDSERREMHRHPGIGARIVGTMAPLAHLAPAVRAGHERWDGRGYPDGLAGEQIPLASRIVFVCDAYDAMRSERPYRAALSSQEARGEIAANIGSQFCEPAGRALLAVTEHEESRPRHGPSTAAFE